MRKLLLLVWTVLCLWLCAPTVFASEAMEVSGKALVSGHSGFGSVNRLFDGRTIEATKIKDGGHITLQHPEGIASVYLVLNREYGPVRVTDEGSGKTAILAKNGYLHELLNLEGTFGYAPAEVTLRFDSGEAELCELSAFTLGELPDWVQRWEAPAEAKADLVLFSAHGDDEQLFFTGMLPYYAKERQYSVQVVYMTDHRNMTLRRTHEMLDGLWAVGVTHYPVFGRFGDYNTGSAAEAYQKYSYKGISREEILAFVVENVRRFRPKVAVGHDLKGEYGHGMHMAYAELLCEAADISADGSRFPESAETYGVWDIPKTYLHLYPENRIFMDWDVPLKSFDGMTAYEVTRELGFPCHVSQQSYYSWYFDGIDTASGITQYSPCEFGMYRSRVGEDLLKNDFFEHLTTHAQDRELEERRKTAESALQSEPVQPASEEPNQEQIAETVSEERIMMDSESKKNDGFPEKIVEFFRHLFGENISKNF